MPLRRTTLAPWLACALVAACASSPDAQRQSDASVPYLVDAQARRAALEASIVNPENAYSKLRLERYAVGTSRDWDHLPEWNPATESIAVGELDAAEGASPSAFASTPAALDLPSSITSEDDPALIALGRTAFSRYPMQRAPYASVAVRSRHAASQYGAWTDAARGVGGLVRTRMADGSAALALTCSSCHSSPRSGAIEDGLPNAKLDIGAALLASPMAPVDAETRGAIDAWGKGRIDVTTTAGTYPARIPDLRPVRFLTHLHQEGTLRQNDLTALAIRIETLIIVSSGQVIRPPRVVALALAAYVWSLAETLPPASVADAAHPRGAQLFASNCATCHAGPGFTGDPVSLARVGTDPWLGESPDRGTGAYRVPSLHGVGSRGPLLHDGTLSSVDAMLDPTRLSAAFGGRLHGAGALPGHVFGLDLAAEDRAEIVAWLKML